MTVAGDWPPAADAAMQSDIMNALADNEREILAVCRQNECLAREIGVWLEPAIASCQRERERLIAKVGRMDEHRSRTAVLERQLMEARHEMAAMQGSRSWKVTAPARHLTFWLRRLLAR